MKKGRFQMKRVLASVMFLGFAAGPAFGLNESDAKGEKEGSFVIMYNCGKNAPTKLRESDQNEPCVAVKGNIYIDVKATRQM